METPLGADRTERTTAEAGPRERCRSGSGDKATAGPASFADATKNKTGGRCPWPKLRSLAQVGFFGSGFREVKPIQPERSNRRIGVISGISWPDGRSQGVQTDGIQGRVGPSCPAFFFLAGALLCIRINTRLAPGNALPDFAGFREFLAFLPPEHK